MFQALKSFFVSEPKVETGADEVHLVEAAGTTIDADEDGYRRLTGKSMRDLPDVTHRRQRELGVYLWQSNPLANWLIEIRLAFLLAEGVALDVADEQAKEWLESFWHDPINEMDLEFPRFARMLSISGDLCLPVFVNDVTGHTRISFLDPDQVETVVTDPDNRLKPIGVVERRNRKGIQRRWKVIYNGPEEIFTQRTQEIRETFSDGHCFLFTINNLPTGSRGNSDLLAIIDWLDAYDQAMFSELDRWKELRSFLWDVTLKGATPDEVEARAKKIGAPPPGSTRVHNDSEIWEPLTPDLKGQDGGNFARTFRNHILGAQGYPEHWYGGGGDVNRASAAEMGEPTFKMLAMRQMVLGHILEKIGTFVVHQRLKVLYGATVDQGNADDYRVSATWPELTAKDTSKYAAAIQQVVTSMAIAINEGLLSQEKAVEMIAAMAARIGVELDPEEELAKAKAREEAKAEQQAEEDLFGRNSDDPDDSDDKADAA